MRFHWQHALVVATACAAMLSPAARAAEPTEPNAAPKAELGVVDAAVNLATGSQDPDAPQRIELRITQASEPRPALKYRLLPSPSERTPGNAATYYYRALLHVKNISKEHWAQFDNNSDAWLSSDPNVFPKEQVAKWLPAGAWQSQLQTAAYREYCDWDYRIQDLRGMAVLGFPLQEIQDCRQLGRLIRLKAHYEIMDGRPADAMQTLRLGYQLAHDVAQAPLLINGLVGIAIARMMNEELLALIRHSDINLYWSIALLPQPLVDLRPAMQFEMTMPQQLFPFLKDAETQERTPEEWRRLIVAGVTGLAGLEGGRQTDGWQGELAAAAMVAKIYPAAKAALLASGMEREKVEAMPAAQVVAIQTARSTDYAFQEIYKNFLLPYHEASIRLPDVEQRLIQEGYLGPGVHAREGLPIANLLLPALNNVLRAEVRLARDFAALQAVEAIRMHAAASGGKLPASLADVKVVSTPHDPATGKPFAYAYDAASGAVMLDVPALANEPARGNAKRYVIRVK